MEAEEFIDMQNELHRFSVSWVTIRVIASLLTTFITAWNLHTIPSRNGGILDVLATTTCRIHALPPLQVPSVLDAVTLHDTIIGQLTHESTYGEDPLRMYPHLIALRESDFSTAFPLMEIFSNVTHNNSMMLKEVITHSFDSYPFHSLDSFKLHLHVYMCTSTLCLIYMYIPLLSYSTMLHT